MTAVAFGGLALLFGQSLLYLMLLLSVSSPASRAFRMRACSSSSSVVTSSTSRGLLLFGAGMADRARGVSGGRGRGRGRGKSANPGGVRSGGPVVPEHFNSHSTTPNSAVRRRLLSFSSALIGSSALLARAGAATATAPGSTGSSTTLISARTMTPLLPELTSSEVRSTVVTKRPLDRREYRALQLDNKLRVLLISDQSGGSNRAAAALDVHVGSFSDPADTPGLAHFAEHMCFLGTKKYPDETDFSKFLSSHGGSSNAYTDSEDTVYYFDCTDKHLEPALDRFAQFFVAPSFTSSATSRELNAIDSEHAKNINNDAFRFYQLEKDQANKDHPLSKFATGNKQTLETDTLSRGVNVRDELLKFHERYYSSNQMTLAVTGTQSLDTMEKWVTEKFSSVPNRQQSAPEVGWWGGTRPYDVQQVAYELQIVPVSESLRRLTLSWPIWIPRPELKRRYLDSKPETILAHLLGHEGAGSIRSWIINKGWGNGVQASVGIDISDMELFEMSIDLTDEGLKHRYEIIELIFAYIDMIKSKGLPDYVVPEVAQLFKIGFDFAENRSPTSTVSSVVADMQQYPPDRYLTGSRLVNPNDDDFRSYLSNLVPEQTQVKTASKIFEGKTQNRAKWYDTAYSRVDLGAETAKWRDTRYTKFPDLHFPVRNELVPTKFDLIGPPATVESDKQRALAESPIVLRNDSRWILFHKTDRYFSQPKVHAVVTLSLPEDIYNVDFAIAAKLFNYCFLDSLAEYSYDATLAGLNYDVEVTSRGLQITFSGYDDKFSVFVERIARELKSFRPPASTFARFKDILRRELGAFKSQQPYQHASYFANLVTETLQFTNEEMKDALARINLSSLDGFLARVLQESFGTALVIGNYNAAQATQLVDLLDTTFPFAPLEPSRRSRRRIALTDLPVCQQTETETETETETAPKKSACPKGYRLKNLEPNENDGNSASTFYFQVPSKEIKDYMMLELLAEIVDQPFYDDLRTRQQLGYIVGSGARNREGYLSLTLTAQSNVVDGEELTSRIETFLSENFLPSLESVSISEFDSYKEGIISRLLEPDQRLTSQAGRFWQEIISSSIPASSSGSEFETPLFDRRRAEAAFLKRVTKTELVAFATDLLAWDGMKRRLLVSQVTSTKIESKFSSDSTRNTTSGTGYTDITDTRKYTEGVQLL